jgi:hypothetical protein
MRRINRSKVPCNSSMRSPRSLVDILGENNVTQVERQGGSDCDWRRRLNRSRGADNPSCHFEELAEAADKVRFRDSGGVLQVPLGAGYRTPETGESTFVAMKKQIPRADYSKVFKW